MKATVLVIISISIAAGELTSEQAEMQQEPIVSEACYVEFIRNIDNNNDITYITRDDKSVNLVLEACKASKKYGNGKPSLAFVGTLIIKMKKDDAVVRTLEIDNTWEIYKENGALYICNLSDFKKIYIAYLEKNLRKMQNK